MDYESFSYNTHFVYKLSWYYIFSLQRTGTHLAVSYICNSHIIASTFRNSHWKILFKKSNNNDSNEQPPCDESRGVSSRMLFRGSLFFSSDGQGKLDTMYLLFVGKKECWQWREGWPHLEKQSLQQAPRPHRRRYKMCTGSSDLHLTAKLSSAVSTHTHA